MPELTDDQVRQEIAAERISFLSLDTNIFDKYKHRLEYGLLKRLSQFAGTEVRIVLSEIVLREVRRHMIDNAEGALAHFRSALKQLGGAWNIRRDDRDAASNALLGGRSSDRVAEERLAAFQRSTEAVIVGVAQRVTMGELLERYFGMRVPFGHKEEKKHEFPDAIAHLALEKYAEDEGKVILLVSEDIGWKQFAIASQHLVCASDLGKAMSYFQTLPLVVCARLAERLRRGELPELEGEIERALADFADGMDLYIEAASNYFYEQDLPEVEIVDVRYEHDPLFVPVEQDDDVYVLEVRVSTSARVTCSFSFSIRDPVDKDYVSVGSTTAVQDVDMPFSLTITIQGDPDGDFEVVESEVIQSERTVDFGEVEPDFGDPDY